MYFKFFKRQYWDKRSVEDRRRNCAVLPKNRSVRSNAQIKRREHEKPSVRAKVEHVFGVVKGQLGYRKTRYRGLRKQTVKLNLLFAMANLILADRPCLAV